MGSWDDDERRAQRAEENYKQWAARERAKGNDSTADRLEKKGDAIGRTHGPGNRYSGGGGGGAPSSGGCALVIIAGGIAVSALATPLAIRLWEVLA